jgi:outer membrane protein TolC
VVVLWLPAWSQQLTLSEALRTAVARSQQIVAADASAAAVSEMAVAAGQLPDPVLKLGVENVPLSGPDRFSLTRDFMTMQRIGVMQELTRSDKRRLRVERLQQDARRIQAERRQTIASIQRETALAWIESRYAQETLQLVERQLNEAELQADGAELTFRTGRGSQSDVFAARAAVATLQDKLRLAHRQVETARLGLTRWIGLPAAALAAGGTAPWQEPPAALALLQRLEDIPALAMQSAQVAAAETEVRQAETERRPDVTVEAMYGRRGPAFPDMFSVGVSIPLPINQGQRQNREVAAKLATLSEARARLEDAKLAQEASLRVGLAEWEVGRRRIQRLNQDLVPVARNRTAGALIAYSVGKADLAAVLAARRDELDALMQVLSLEIETARLWAQLNYQVPQEPAATRDQP